MKYEKVCSHYREQARKYGANKQSTMLDDIVRDNEVDALSQFVSSLAAPARCYRQTVRVLEVCCGNGYLLEQLAGLSRCENVELFGVELVQEMVDIAVSRNIKANIVQGNVLSLPYEDQYFDAVISERGIINILDEDKQVAAFAELARVMKPGAAAALIEGFKEPLDNLNKARDEFMLDPISEPEFNNWFTKERWQRFLEQGFEERVEVYLPQSNFLSSHYFVTRFLHELVRPEGGKLRNTEFAKFLSEALPPAGDYSPVKIKYLTRKQH